MSIPQNNHSTNRASAHGWSTQRIAIYALFVALGIALSFISFPIFPAAPFLEYDFSGVICLIAAFAYGPAAGVTVSLLIYVPLMNMSIIDSFALLASLIYHHKRSRKQALRGLIAGAVLAIIVALGLNVAATPLYYHIAVSKYLAMIIPVYLPFNLLKMGLHSIITFLCYKPVSRMVKKDL